MTRRILHRPLSVVSSSESYLVVPIFVPGKLAFLFGASAIQDDVTDAIKTRQWVLKFLKSKPIPLLLAVGAQMTAFADLVPVFSDEPVYLSYSDGVPVFLIPVIQRDLPSLSRPSWIFSPVPSTDLPSLWLCDARLLSLVENTLRARDPQQSHYCYLLTRGTWYCRWRGLYLH